MNMVKTDRERQGQFRIAELVGIPKDERTERALFPEDRQDQILVSWEGENAIFSTLLWEQAPWNLRLALVQTALAAFDCIKGAAEARLKWSFSSKFIARADAGKLLSQWIDDGGPPVMDFLDFVSEAHGEGRRLSSNGLAVIFGHEIEAQIKGPSDQRLATMVGHLAQDLLYNGPLTTDEAVGPDGQSYCLQMIKSNSNPVPTIRITRR